MTQSCRVVRAGSPSLWSLMELEVCRARTTVNPDYLARSVPSEFSHNILCQQSTSFKSSAAVYVLQDKTYSAISWSHGLGNFLDERFLRCTLPLHIKWMLNLCG